MSQYTIDKEKVKEPCITLTGAAFSQIGLILDNDITLTEKNFRVVIDSKGCAGFKYATGFDEVDKDDFLVNVNGNTGRVLTILIDPFTATYLQTATIDFVQDHLNDQEGFTIDSENSDTFQGKFWKKSPELNPPVKE